MSNVLEERNLTEKNLQWYSTMSILWQKYSATTAREKQFFIFAKHFLFDNVLFLRNYHNVFGSVLVLLRTLIYLATCQKI